MTDKDKRDVALEFIRIETETLSTRLKSIYESLEIDDFQWFVYAIQKEWKERVFEMKKAHEEKKL